MKGSVLILSLKYAITDVKNSCGNGNLEPFRSDLGYKYVFRHYQYIDFVRGKSSFHC